MSEPILVDGVQVGERLFVTEIAPVTPYPGDEAHVAAPEIVGDAAGLSDESDATYVKTASLASAGFLRSSARLKVEKASRPISPANLTKVVLHVRTKNSNTSSITAAEYTWTLFNWIPDVPWDADEYGTDRLWGVNFSNSIGTVPADGVTETDEWGLLGPVWYTTDEAYFRDLLAPLFSADGTYNAGFQVGPLAGTLEDSSFDAETYFYEFWVDVYYTVTEVPRLRQWPIAPTRKWPPEKWRQAGTRRAGGYD